MVTGIQSTSVNILSISTTTLGGSLIFRPMTKIHAVGQDMYTDIYIKVYLPAATFAESTEKFSATEKVTLPPSFCPHGPSCVMGDNESTL
jgi:hypothetical protein